MFSGKATNTNCIVFGLTRPGLEPTFFRTRGEHANHYTTGSVRVARSLVFCVVFCTSLFVLLSSFFGHYMICHTTINCFWLPLWYLQTLLIYQSNHKQIIAPEYHTLHVIYQSNHKQIIAPEYHTLYMLYISRIINRLLLQDITHYMLYISLIINRLLLQNITHYTCCISVES